MVSVAVGVLSTDTLLLWQTVMHNPSWCHLLQLPEQVSPTVCGPWSAYPCVQGLHADGPAHIHSWFMCTLLENNCTAQVLVLPFCLRLQNQYSFLAESSLVSVVWPRIFIRQEPASLRSWATLWVQCHRWDYIPAPSSLCPVFSQPTTAWGKLRKFLKELALSMKLLLSISFPKTVQKTYSQKFVSQLYLLGNVSFLCVACH